MLSTSFSLDSFNSSYYQKLIGIITIEPTIGIEVDAPINTTLLNAAFDIWKQYEPETFPGSAEVNNFAYFAFDATWSLIQSSQKLCPSNINNSSSCLSFVESSFCYDRRFLNGNIFLNLMSTTNFLGVSGPIEFNNDTTDRVTGNYYIAKNVQLLGNHLKYVSILQWSGSGSWESGAKGSAIVWSGNSLKPPTSYPGLQGVTLRIAVILTPPFTMKSEIIDEFGQNITKLSGYGPDLIDLLKNNLGFIPDIRIVSSNLTYDHMTQAVANDEYDILVGDITITSKRRNYVDFSNSIFDDSIRIIVRQGSSVSIDLLSYLSPFSTRLWLVILGALIVASILLCLLEGRENETLKDRSFVSLAALSVCYTFCTIVGCGADFNVSTGAGRLLSVGLYILSIILVATYTTNLESDLTLSKSKNIISGVQDLRNGKIPYSRIGILVGTRFEEYYLQKIAGGSRNFYPLYSQQEIYSNLLNNKIDASILDTGLLEYATNVLYCNLTLVGSTFDTSAYGIVQRKNWLYTQALDVAVLSLQELGTLDRLRKKWFEGNMCTSSSSIVVSTSYKVESVTSLFLTFGVICILSVLLFAWLKRRIIKEYLYNIIHRNGSLAKKDGSIETVGTETYRSNANLPVVVEF